MIDHHRPTAKASLCYSYAKSRWIVNASTLEIVVFFINFSKFNVLGYGSYIKQSAHSTTIAFNINWFSVKFKNEVTIAVELLLADFSKLVSMESWLAVTSIKVSIKSGFSVEFKNRLFFIAVNVTIGFFIHI